MSGLKGLKKRRRVQVLLVSLLCIFAILGLFSVLPKDAFQFFRSPSEVKADPPLGTELFRIGGLVVEGSIERISDQTIQFVVSDGAADIRVVYDGIVPDLFEENQGVVAQGYYESERFSAIEILAKHDENYMPKEVIDALKEQGTYVDPNAGVTQP